MSDFDDLELSRRLRAAAGGEPDLASAHAALGRRVTRARRRRAAVLTGTAAVSMLMLGSVYARQATDEPGRIGAADAPGVSDATQDTGGATTTSNATDSVSTPAPATSVTSVTAPSSGDEGDQRSEETMALGTTTSRTIVGVGGSISVRATAASTAGGAGSLRLTASAPTAGFTARTTTSRPDEVAVELSSAGHRTRIRVRLEGDRLRIDVDETVLGSTATTPSTEPVTTGPATTGPATTGPVTTGPATTGPGTTAPDSPSTTDADDDGDGDGGDDGGDDNSGSGSSGSSGSGSGSSDADDSDLRTETETETTVDDD